jgi:hypothetical protein
MTGAWMMAIGSMRERRISMAVKSSSNKPVWSDKLLNRWFHAEYKNAPIKGRSANIIIMDEVVDTRNSHLTVRRARGSRLPRAGYVLLGTHRFPLSYLVEKGTVSLSLAVQAQSLAREQSRVLEHRSEAQQEALKHIQLKAALAKREGQSLNFDKYA